MDGCHSERDITVINNLPQLPVLALDRHPSPSEGDRRDSGGFDRLRRQQRLSTRHVAGDARHSAVHKPYVSCHAACGGISITRGLKFADRRRQAASVSLKGIYSYRDRF